MLCVVVFVVLALACYRLVMRSSDFFVRVATAGIMSWIIVQAMINVGAVIGLSNAQVAAMLGSPAVIVSDSFGRAWRHGQADVAILLRDGRRLTRHVPQASGSADHPLTDAQLGRKFDSLVAPILLIGHFLVLLQLVKLYEQRANRDYAQLIVLSLLLMVAAAINTASLLFGLMFIAYLFLSLYCCLLFHLKVETDTARAALASSAALVARSAGSSTPLRLASTPYNSSGVTPRTSSNSSGVMSFAYFC